MPKQPSKSQNREQYMSSCVEQLVGEGKPKKKAIDMCLAVWYQYRGKKKAKRKKKR